MRPITGRHSLFPRSHTHLPNSFPCGSPAIAELLAWADKWAYRVPRRRHEQFRFCLFAGSRVVRVPRQLNGASDCVPFWPKPVSAFGLFAVTAFISNSNVLTMLPNLAPHPPRRWQKAPHSRERSAVQRTGYVVPVASHQVVTNSACTGRLRLTEQPVPLLAETRWNNPLRDFHVALTERH